MYDDILIPTDGSDVTETTLDHALQIATDRDARVHALYVVDHRLIMAADRDRRDEIEDDLHSEGETAVESVRERVEAAGLDAAVSIRRGTPHREILEYVDENGIDLIVMGTHGKTPREKLQTMGSVTERVVDSSPIPVLVVRNVDRD